MQEIELQMKQALYRMARMAVSIVLAGIVSMIAVMANSAYSEPDFSQIWSTQSLRLEIAEGQSGIAEMRSNLEERYFKEPAITKIPQNPNSSVSWVACQVFSQRAKIEIQKSEALSLQKRFAQLTWDVKKSLLDGIIGLAPSHIFVIADKDFEGQFWLLEVYGGEANHIGYLSVAFSCGSELFQHHPNSNFGYLAESWLITKAAEALAEKCEGSEQK